MNPEPCDDCGTRSENVWTPGNGAVGVRDKYYLPDEPGIWEATWHDLGELSFDVSVTTDGKERTCSACPVRRRMVLDRQLSTVMRWVPMTFSNCKVR
ncbi:hypothetical protein ACTMTF_07795 [Nonomuraea sp. ZG12]|uniref:hypothetical protein n=1 Tax=Nonomuraea sp. ZG12 TaxID=3452207 RepID=UPI003F8A5767